MQYNMHYVTIYFCIYMFHKLQNHKAVSQIVCLKFGLLDNIRNSVENSNNEIKVCVSIDKKDFPMANNPYLIVQTSF